MRYRRTYRGLGPLMRSMGHPEYRYQPISEAKRAKMRSSQRQRLGIPEGSVRIYGIDVPEHAEFPLRYYASTVCRKFGWAAAVAFVAEAQENGWRSENPAPARSPAKAPPLVRALAKRARAAERLAKRDQRNTARMVRGACLSIERLAKALRRSPRRATIIKHDWELIEELLAVGTSREEVAAYFGMTLKHFRYELKKRKAAGRSSFGSGVEVRKRRVG